MAHEVDKRGRLVQGISAEHGKTHDGAHFEVGVYGATLTANTLKISVPAGKELHAKVLAATTTAGTVTVWKDRTITAAGAVAGGNKDTGSSSAMSATITSGTAAGSGGTQVCATRITSAYLPALIGDPFQVGDELILKGNAPGGAARVFSVEQALASGGASLLLDFYEVPYTRGV